MNQRKGQPQIFFGIAILSAAHAIQLALPLKAGSLKQYCLLQAIPFAANKMSLFFQKRFGGIARLTAIRFLFCYSI
jgi:hypothetical protein